MMSKNDMKTSRIYKFLAGSILCLTVLVTAGCNKFLDQAPDDRADLTSLSNIKELLTAAYPDNSYQLLYDLRSDNSDDKGMRAWSQSQWLREVYAFQPQCDNTYQDSPSGYWRALYWATSSANQALVALDELEDLSPSEKVVADELRGEALVCRAYDGYMLAQTFCRPYDPSTADQMLGLPYPKVPENELLKQYTRGTLKELYDNIKKDFDEGYALIGSNYDQPKYHFTKTSAAAFGSRLYRTLGDWDKVIEMSREALGSDPAAKVRDYPRFAKMTWAGSKAAWSLPDEKCNLMVSSCLSNAHYLCGDSRYSMTVSIFNKEVQPNGGFLGSGLTHGMRQYGGDLYLNFAKHPEYRQYTNSLKTNWYAYTGFVLFSGEEVLFNLAEAYAMKGDFAKSNDLMQIFVARWFTGYSPNSYLYKVDTSKIMDFYAKDSRAFKPFYPLTEEQTCYVKAITDLRRFAFVQEGLRWLDIRHYNLPVKHKLLHDNDRRTTIHELEPGDPRYAFQLPSSVLGYDLEPNPGYDKSLPID